jgi:rRNA maturation endonuclease Nob1
LTELVAAIYNIVEEVGEIESEDLLNVVSKKLLGVHRLTTEWRDRIEEAVDKTVSWGWISKANETFVRAADYQKGSEKPWFRQN